MDQENISTEAANQVANQADLNAGTQKPLFGIEITWAEGHGVDNESDARDGAALAKEFYESGYTDEDMPASIKAITIKRL